METEELFKRPITVSLGEVQAAARNYMLEKYGSIQPDFFENLTYEEACKLPWFPIKG